MNVSEERLLQSGFSQEDPGKIKINIDSYGGTLDEAIQELATKFRVLIWISSACMLVFIFLLLFVSEPK
ncbi:hypothetical protein [Erwinia psidii]|nr:hypothetical protein [Erwinia psidii]